MSEWWNSESSGRGAASRARESSRLARQGRRLGSGHGARPQAKIDPARRIMGEPGFAVLSGAGQRIAGMPDRIHGRLSGARRLRTSAHCSAQRAAKHSWKSQVVPIPTSGVLTGW